MSFTRRSFLAAAACSGAAAAFPTTLSATTAPCRNSGSSRSSR